MCSNEEWKVIDGFDNYYDVSTCGSVRSWRRGRYGRSETPRNLRPGQKASGHWLVCLMRDGESTPRTVHSLVAQTFLGPRPDRMEVCHNDGNPSNNHLSNLRYDTHKANAQDMVSHSRSPKGVRNGQNVLSEDDVLAIVRARQEGAFQREIAAKFGVSRSAVNNILNGYHWTWLTGITPANERVGV